MTGDPRPVGRPPKDGRLHQVRLTEDVRAAVLARAEREGIKNLSDAVAAAARWWAEHAVIVAVDPTGGTEDEPSIVIVGVDAAGESRRYRVVSDPRL